MADTRRVLESNGQVRGVDAERHTVTAVISTGNVARDGAAINPMGWRFDNYRKNPVVLFGHNINTLPVARTIDLQNNGDGLVATAEFDVENEDAMELFKSIQRGFLRGTSVRWTPIRTEVRRMNGKEVLYFAEQDLVEWSFTPVPVDPSSLVIRSLDGAELKVEDFAPRSDDAAVTTAAAEEASEEAVVTAVADAALAAEVAQAEAEAAPSRAALIPALAAYVAARVTDD